MISSKNLISTKTKRKISTLKPSAVGLSSNSEKFQKSRNLSISKISRSWSINSLHARSSKSRSGSILKRRRRMNKSKSSNSLTNTKKRNKKTDLLQFSVANET